MAALATGAGYLAGGGLFSGLTARLAATALKLGLRLALVPYITQSLLKMGGTLLPPAADAVHGEDANSDAARTTTKPHHDTNQEKHS
jgi:hypothetical protein